MPVEGHDPVELLLYQLVGYPAGPLVIVDVFGYDMIGFAYPAGELVLAYVLCPQRIPERILFPVIHIESMRAELYLDSATQDLTSCNIACVIDVSIMKC